MINNKKKIYIIISVVLIVLSISILFLYNKDDTKIIWTIIDENPFNQDILIEESEVDINSNEENYEKIKSMVRTLCNLWSIDKLVWTTSFKIIKKSIDEVKDSQNNTEKFLHVDLPWIVYEACPNSDWTFLDKLLKYLQAEWIWDIENDKVDIAKFNEFLNDIKFDEDWINKEKLKTNSEYFDEVFFEKNWNPLKASYFSEYLSRTDDSDYFFNTKSLLSLSETNDILEDTIWNFDSFLRKQWFNWIEEFRTYVLKNNNFTNVDDVVKSMKDDYLILQEKVKNLYWIDLNIELSSISSTAKFYKENYIKVTEDLEIEELFKNVWENHLIFSIVNNDYADWLDETWSAKEFFWDYVVWNAIIKIWFIHLFDSYEK